MDADPKTVLVFNADLQRDTPHTVDIDTNGEIVLTCVENGRFLKFPAGTTAEELKALLIAHKAGNEGQISQESIEADKSALIDALTADLGTDQSSI